MGPWTDPSPTGVNVAGFGYSPLSRGIALSWWADVNGSDIAGFNIQRSTEENGLYSTLNAELIMAMADGAGEDFTYLDESAVAGVRYYYRLVPLNLLGGEEEAQVLVGQYYQTFLSLTSR